MDWELLEVAEVMDAEMPEVFPMRFPWCG